MQRFFGNSLSTSTGKSVVHRQLVRLETGNSLPAPFGLLLKQLHPVGTPGNISWSMLFIL